jgi:hypothetical protein
VSDTALLEASAATSAALVVARVVDAGSGLPRPVARVSSPSPHTRAHVAAGGFLVLSGRPELAVPGLATTARELTALVEFDDAPPLELTFALAAGTGLPLRAGDVEVELPPATLQGTVAEAQHPYAPIPGAAIAVTDATPGRAWLGLRTPLQADHPAGAPVQGRTLTTAGPAAHVDGGVRAGARAVVLDDVTGCATAGALLALGDATTLEHVAVSAVDAPARRVTLALPLRRTREHGSPARAVTASPSGSATTLARPARAGDGAVALAGLSVPAAVADGGPDPELRVTGALTDGAGRWRLDGLRAVGRVTVAASASGFVTSSVVWEVDHRQPNVIDLDLPS